LIHFARDVAWEVGDPGKAGGVHSAWRKGRPAAAFTMVSGPGSSIRCPKVATTEGDMLDSDPVRGSSDDRHCGACTACCVHLTIPAGLAEASPKPSGIPCPHAGALGCRIHARRPRVCVEFACGWLRNALWPPHWRPDRCGILCLEDTAPSGTACATLVEIQPGALHRADAQEILDHLLLSTAVVSTVNCQGERESVFGRRERVSASTAPRRLAG
jgi:hypothetical protein